MPETNYRREYRRYFKRLVASYENMPAVRISLNILLTLFTISFFALFALRPTLNTISELVSNIKSQEEIKAKLEQKIKDLSLAQTVWNREQKRLELISQALPKNPQPDTYIKQIEGIVKRRGLLINFLKVDEVALRGELEEKSQEKTKIKNPKVGTLGVSVSVTGNYSSLLGFLEDLESLRRAGEATSVSFTAAKSLSPGQITLSLTTANEVPFYKEVGK